MKHSNRIIGIVMVFLVCMVVLFAFLNRGNQAQKEELQEKEQFVISIDGKEQGRISKKQVEQMGVSEYTVTMDTSKTDPTDVVFEGVELKDILEQNKIKISDYKTIQAKALDGYSTAMTVEEVMKPDNVILCIKKDGKYLGTKGDGGMGPFLVIIREDSFSQRWCKYLEAVDLR